MQTIPLKMSKFPWETLVFHYPSTMKKQLSICHLETWNIQKLPFARTAVHTEYL